MEQLLERDTPLTDSNGCSSPLVFLLPTAIPEVPSSLTNEELREKFERCLVNYDYAPQAVAELRDKYDRQQLVRVTRPSWQWLQQLIVTWPPVLPCTIAVCCHFAL